MGNLQNMGRIKTHEKEEKVVANQSVSIRYCLAVVCSDLFKPIADYLRLFVEMPLQATT
jgi:hypothetical protein